MVAQKVILVCLAFLAVGHTLPQVNPRQQQDRPLDQQDNLPGNFFNPANLPNLLPFPPPLGLPPFRQPDEDTFYDPFAFQMSEPPTFRPTETTAEQSLPELVQAHDQFAVDEANPPCKQDGDCLCNPTWTFCIKQGSGSGQCALNCTQFCGSDAGCQIQPEVTPSKDLTCHLDRSRIICSQSKKSRQDSELEEEAPLENPFLPSRNSSSIRPEVAIRPEPVFIPNEAESRQEPVKPVPKPALVATTEEPVTTTNELAEEIEENPSKKKRQTSTTTVTKKDSSKEENESTTVISSPVKVSISQRTEPELKEPTADLIQKVDQNETEQKPSSTTVTVTEKRQNEQNLTQKVNTNEIHTSVSSPLPETSNSETIAEPLDQTNNKQVQTSIIQVNNATNNINIDHSNITKTNTKPSEQTKTTETNADPLDQINKTGTSAEPIEAINTTTNSKPFDQINNVLTSSIPDNTHVETSSVLETNATGFTTVNTINTIKNGKPHDTINTIKTAESFQQTNNKQVETPINNQVNEETPTNTQYESSGNEIEGNENFHNAIYSFSQNLLVELAQDEPHNLVFSPFSIHTALAMLASGASENSTTQSQLLAALGDIGSIDNLNQYYSGLLSNYKNKFSNQVSVGNKIWTSNSIIDSINKDYTDLLEKDFGSEIGILEDENPEVQVNEWIANVTKGKIPKIVDKVGSDTVMMLTNAIYFKEAWTVAFKEVVGGNQTFTLSNGETVLVPMMQRSSHEIVTAKFTLIDNYTFQAVAIPYASDNGRFQLTIIMGENPESMNLVLSNPKLRGADKSIDLMRKVASEIERADSETVERSVVMPTFALKSDIKVKTYLEKLGIVSAFTVGAEFGRISNTQPLKVSSVTHVATLEVTTEGTVGAAATGVEIAPFSAVFEQPKEVVINKPFLFSIRDRTQGTILFMGKVTDPSLQ